jgi:hypothetical protein
LLESARVTAWVGGRKKKLKASMLVTETVTPSASP